MYHVVKKNSNATWNCSWPAWDHEKKELIKGLQKVINYELVSRGERNVKHLMCVCVCVYVILLKPHSSGPTPDQRENMLKAPAPTILQCFLCQRRYNYQVYTDFKRSSRDGLSIRVRLQSKPAAERLSESPEMEITDDFSWKYVFNQHTFSERFLSKWLIVS